MDNNELSGKYMQRCIMKFEKKKKKMHVMKMCKRSETYIEFSSQDDDGTQCNKGELTNER